MFNKNNPYCNGCKNRPSVYLTVITNSEAVELSLCDSCPLLKRIILGNPWNLESLAALLSQRITNPRTQEEEEVCPLDTSLQANRIEKLLILKEKLDDAIEKEDFENAARLRDQIREVRKQPVPVSSK